MVAGWPDSLDELVRELKGARGRPALVDGAAPHAARTLAWLAERMEPISIGGTFAALEQPPSSSDLFAVVGAQPTLLLDIEVLFTPALKIDVLPSLRRTAQRVPLFVAWPGQIGVTRLSYSLPGRADYFDEAARDLVVLRPAPIVFPDEIPYRLERFPP